ncbi:hypothetical protein D3C71_301640 [compost metagenome]
MIVDLRTAIVDRACAALEDGRAAAIGTAFGLSAGAAWIVARLEEEPQALTRYTIRKRLPRSDLAVLRSVSAISPLVTQIRDKMGGDAVFTDLNGYCLTPLGRIRIRVALGEPAI